MGLIRDDEFVRCPVCGSYNLKQTNSCYEECHTYLLVEYTVVCGECGQELGTWDHGAIFPTYL